MSKGKSINAKVVAISCAIVIALGLCVTGLVLGFNSKADLENTGEIYSSYDDDTYGDEEDDFSFEEDDSVEKAVYQQYSEEENLDVQVNDGVMSYTVNSSIKDDVKSVKSVLAVINKEKYNIVNEENHYLYMGTKADCKYDASTGNVECTPDYKWLLVNNEQPMAMYSYSEDENKLLTPVYIKESDSVEYLVISKANDVYTVDGILKDDSITPLENGTALAPAYASYDKEIIDIEEDGAEAEEVLNDKLYTYGTDFNLTYDVLPNGDYLYSMNVIYVENEAKNYGYYTNGNEFSFDKEKLNNNENGVLTGAEGDSYVYVKGVSYIKEMLKHNLSISKDDRKQAKKHLIEGEQKSRGYIATRNYRVINTALRTDTEDELDEDDKKTVEALDRITTSNQLSQDTILVRNVNFDYLSSVFGITLDNGETLQNYMRDEMSIEAKKYILEKFKKFEGTKVTEKAYLSTSMIPEANCMNFKPVRFIIKAAKETKGYVTLNKAESEFIMPRGTSMVLDSISYDDAQDIYVVDASIEQD